MIQKQYRFTTQRVFDDICDANGWQRIPGSPYDVPGAQVDVIGPIISKPTLDGEMMIPGILKDPRWHINVVWFGEPSDILSAYEVYPATPDRAFGLPASAEDAAPAVPEEIDASAGIITLRRNNLLLAVETAIKQVGGEAEIIWNRSSRWRRNSPLMESLAKQLEIPEEKIDQLFIEADRL